MDAYLSYQSTLLIDQHIGIVELLSQLNSLTNDDDVNVMKSEIDERLKAIKATYFDMIEAGGSPVLKTLILGAVKRYEASPYFYQLPSQIEENNRRFDEVAAAVADVTDVNRQRIKPGTGHERFEPYTAEHSRLHFQSGDLIRTPFRNNRGDVFAGWFYVDDVQKVNEGVVTLFGWRLAETRKPTQKYRDRRAIIPDQYTYIEARGMARNDAIFVE